MLSKYSYSVAFLTLFFLTSPAFAAVSLPFTVNMSEVVTVNTGGGTPRIAVDVGGVTRYANYTAGSGTAALTFTYDVVLGDVDLDGVSVSSPVQLNGGTIKDNGDNNATLTFTPPNTTGIKVNVPSLGMDFVADADGRYTLNGTVYNDLTSFIAATGGVFSRTSIGTYYDSTGTLQTAASGTPRFDYNPVTLAAKGLLIEDSRSNYIKNSAQLDQTGWNTRAGSTTIPVAVTAPDGSATSYLGTKSSGDGYVWQFYTHAASTSYTYSIFVKGGASASTLTIQRWDGTASSSQSFPIAAGQNWTRVSLTYTTSASVAGGDVGYYIGTNPIYTWGAQLEQGAFVTSYIPTAATTVTRAVDSFYIPTGAWFSAPQGTASVEADYSGVSTVGAVFGLSDNVGSNRVDVRAGQNSAFISSGGVNTILSPFTFATTNTKFSMAYSASIAAASKNGAAAITGTPRVPVGINRLWLGNIDGGNASYTLGGHISKLKYYPLAINTTQLQLLSQ